MIRLAHHCRYPRSALFIAAGVLAAGLVQVLTR